MYDQLNGAKGDGKNRAGGEADDGSSFQVPLAPVTASCGSRLLCLPLSRDLKATLLRHPQSSCPPSRAFDFCTPCDCIVARSEGSEGDVGCREHLEKKG